MKLVSRDGTELNLRPTGYEFKSPLIRFLRFLLPSVFRGEDMNFVTIHGNVKHPDGSWQFNDPCLLTSDLPDIERWLRGVVEGRVAPTESKDRWDDQNILDFLEPNLAFSLAARVHDRCLLRIYLGYESAPPWTTGEGREDFSLLIDASLQDVSLAADEWHREVAALPRR